MFKVTEDNYSARGIDGPHDQDDAPIGSGDTGPKALGGMEVNALISHNARSLLREGSVLRSSKNMEFWKQYQYGSIAHFPSEKKTFNKFVSILKQAGVKADKKGDIISFGPLTDKDILEMSAGELTEASRLDAKLRPEKNGLFDEAKTGGVLGDKWTHITLAEPVVNPLFEDPTKSLLGLTTKQLHELYIGKGGAEIKRQLDQIDIPSQLAEVEAALDDPKLLGPKLDHAVKKLKYLRALGESGKKAGDAYVLSVIPVTPPVIRPITVGKSGDTMENDSNLLYRDLILQNSTFKSSIAKKMDEENIQTNRAALDTRVKELTGIIAPNSPHLKNRSVKGALQYLKGDQPKHGFFQRKVIYSKMNLSGRATIIPDQNLGLDEVGLPEDMAWNMYKPFIIRGLTRMGYGAVQAREAVDERSDQAKKVLEAELEKRPVLVNRAPSLWRYSIIAAKPVLRSGKSLQVNTLWEKGTNMDFDGDTMTVHLPVSDEAIEDAKSMLPSKLVYSDKKRGDLLYQPAGEPIVGLYKVTSNLGQSLRGAPRKFKNVEAAWAAYYKGTLKATDLVEITG
jgi:DNA-directed RNA polymerase beta' subunit